MIKIFLISFFAAIALQAAHAWEPAKPVNVIIGMAPGSAMDNAFRIVSLQVEKNTGIKLVSNYRPGAGGSIAATVVSKATADGYTILTMAVPGMSATDRMVVPNKTYTPADFEYAMAYASTTMTIVAHTNDPVNSIQDLIKVLKTEKTTMGDPGAGARLTYELLRENIKFEESNERLVRIEHKGPNETVQDVMSRNIRFGVVPLAASNQYHIAGKLKIIAVTSESRSDSFPSIPTMASVYPNVVYNLTWGVALPKNTPTDIINWYAREFNKAVQNKEVQKLLHDNFFFVDNKLLTPKSLRDKVVTDEKLYAPLVDRVIEQRKQ